MSNLRRWEGMFPAVPTHDPTTESMYRKVFNSNAGGKSNMRKFIVFMQSQHTMSDDFKNRLYQLNFNPDLSYEMLSGVFHVYRINFTTFFNRWIESLSDMEMRLVQLGKNGGKRKQTRRHRKSRKQTRKH
jgi:hypothetical protein